MVLLEARNVGKSFGSGLLQKGRTVALEHFSFAIAGKPPSITAVVGESGSGKTTLARLLLGIEVPSDGAVLYEGKDLRRLTEPSGSSPADGRQHRRPAGRRAIGRQPPGWRR
jgi:peptide/nickel transport system ATP-binding protein